MSFAFDGKTGLIIVQAELTGPAGSGILRLALDTGATSTVVSMGMLVAIGCDPTLAAERVQLTTGSGVEFAPRLKVNAITALGRHRTDFSVLAHTLPPSAVVDGLLGLDFFRGCVLSLDFQRGAIALTE